MRRLAAPLAAFLGGLSLFHQALGALLSHFGVVTPMFGFLFLFAVGLCEGLLALVAGAVALRLGGSEPMRALARFGFGTGVAVVCLLAALLIGRGGGAPINDISTDLRDPPEFVAAPRAPGAPEGPWAYPAHFADVQREAYPDLAGITLDGSVSEVCERAAQAARRQGLVVREVLPSEGRVEAYAVSRIFRFVDDVVVRVRESPSGSRVDVRSRSRDGRSDLGVNATRIRALLGTLAAPGQAKAPRSSDG